MSKPMGISISRQSQMRQSATQKPTMAAKPSVSISSNVSMSMNSFSAAPSKSIMGISTSKFGRSNVTMSASNNAIGSQVNSASISIPSTVNSIDFKSKVSNYGGVSMSAGVKNMTGIDSSKVGI